MPIIPDGTRYLLPPEWEWRETLKQRLHQCFSAWGYQSVQTPALELQDTEHPLAERAFQLIDRDGSLLTLRSEYTTAVARLLQTDLIAQHYPLRLQYAGQVWLRALSSELGRMREFTQVGVELIGVESAAADAELLELAREALESVGVRFEIEVADRRFIHAILQDFDEAAKERITQAVERKAQAELSAVLQDLNVTSPLREDILMLPQLYGGLEVLEEARHIARTPEAHAALDHLQHVVQLSSHQDWLFDLGMTHRHAYYTGLTFRAYTPDFGLPLLGGGRYNNGQKGAGFAIGLERLMRALGNPPAPQLPSVLALDFASAQWARQQGYITTMALHQDLAVLRQEAKQANYQYLAIDQRLEALDD